MSVNVLLCDQLYSVRRQKKLKITRHDVFQPNDRVENCDRAKKYIKGGRNYRVYCSAPLRFEEWQRHQPLTKKKEGTNAEKDEKVEIKEKDGFEWNCFEMKQTRCSIPELSAKFDRTCKAKL